MLLRLPSVSISSFMSSIPSAKVIQLRRFISLSTCMVTFLRFSIPYIDSFFSVISAVDDIEFLFVTVIVSVHESLKVSHDLMSCQLNFNATSHDSKLSSFQDAIISSQNSNWLLLIVTVTPQKTFTSY